MPQVTIRCSDCKNLKQEQSSSCVCVNCGSNHTQTVVSLSARVGRRFDLKAKDSVTRHVEYELRMADDLHRNSGTLSKLMRIINRKQDRYKEKIISAGGEIVRDVDEPLSQHRGHGSARSKVSLPRA